MVLYMSFDKFLLVVESRDLSQADKSINRVSSFPKLSNGSTYQVFFNGNTYIIAGNISQELLCILVLEPLSEKKYKQVDSICFEQGIPKKKIFGNFVRKFQK